MEERFKEQQARTIEAAEAITFEKCAETYIATYKDGWKNGKHADQWTATLQTYVYPVFKDTPVAAIDDALILKVLQPIWKEKTGTASRTRGRIERILDWARVMNYRTGDNPARWKGHLNHLLPKRSRVANIVHHAALPIDETPGFIQVLRQEETVVARAFEFGILNATRTNETMGMRWSEYDEKAQLWTVPGARMKAGRDHRIPLAKRSQLVLAEMQNIRTGDFVFPGGVREKPLSYMGFLMLLRRLGRNDITAHASARPSATGRRNEPISRTKSSKWRSPTPSATRWKPPTGGGDLFEKRRQLAEAWAALCFGLQNWTPIDKHGNEVGCPNSVSNGGTGNREPDQACPGL